MKKSNNGLMLLEMTLAIIFFALSAAVILQVFTVAHQKSIRSEMITAATLLAEDTANMFEAEDADTDMFFTSEGFVKAEEGYTKSVEVNQRQYTLSVTGNEKIGDYGALFQGTLSVTTMGETVHTMPISRFRPKGVFP